MIGAFGQAGRIGDDGKEYIVCSTVSVYNVATLGRQEMQNVMRCLFALVLVYLIVQPVCAADYDEAIEATIKAAKQGWAGSQYTLGVRYAKGLGVARDDAKAVYWYEKAAKQGDAKA